MTILKYNKLRSLILVMMSLLLLSSCLPENPFLSDSPLPHSFPSFDIIKFEHYEEAFQIGLEEKKAPRIAGQHEWYIYNSLVAFKSKERKNPEMYPFIQNLSDQDFKDLASHISKLK